MWFEQNLWARGSVPVRDCSLGGAAGSSTDCSSTQHSSREATENIVRLVHLHLREIYHCPFQSLSKSGFKPQEWHRHFYCLEYLGLLSALPKSIPCSGWSVLAFPPTLCWSLGLLPSTCFKKLDFRCWEKFKRAAPEGTFARSEL